jgi:hypothetical protein
MNEPITNMNGFNQSLILNTENNIQMNHNVNLDNKIPLDLPSHHGKNYVKKDSTSKFDF